MKNTLFAIGEALIDFIPAESGCDFSKVSAFSPKVGGAPANVLGAFSRLGGRTQLLTKLGRDPFGDKILAELRGFGVGTDFVLQTEEANTALAFVSLSQEGERTFSFYRNPSADMLYTPQEVDAVDFSDCFALHFCSVSLGNFPMREAHRRALERAGQVGAMVSFDPNLRFPLWKDTKELKAAVSEFLPAADIVKVAEEELPFITGTQDREEGCRRLLATASLVLCTCGPRGAYAYTRTASAAAPAPAVFVCDTTGAGDGFCGSFLFSLHRAGIGREELGSADAETLRHFLALSNRFAAESVRHPGAIASYPSKL